jgi:tRNA(Ile)-lysidine synthetase-like protein
MYETTPDRLFAVPTAEVPLTNFFRDEILDEGPFRSSAAPTPPASEGRPAATARTCAASTAAPVRQGRASEVGAPVAKLRGARRLKDDVEAPAAKLEIPYRVLLMCGGDLGFAQSKKYDLEVWAAGQKRWLEVSSCSNFEAFQARRAQIRFRSKESGRTELVHTLNGSGLAVPRVLAAILENNLEADGRVRIPAALVAAFRQGRTSRSPEGAEPATLHEEEARQSLDWPAAAAAIAAGIPRSRLNPPLSSGPTQRPQNERWAVALSGGADSVALLLLLWAHWPKRRSRLVALHFDHRLRGAESAADARFCARLCAGLGVPLVAGRWEAGRRKPSEAGAREARFAFFEREMAVRRIRVLWLGHQQDDIAETMLMRLARGSGGGGPGGAPADPRPFAAGGGKSSTSARCSRSGSARSQERCASAGAAWREDSSNAKGVHFRNRLRRDVIPRWVRAAGGTPSREPRFRASCLRRTTARSRPGSTPWSPWGKTGRSACPGLPGRPGPSCGGPSTGGFCFSPGPRPVAAGV